MFDRETLPPLRQPVGLQPRIEPVEQVLQNRTRALLTELGANRLLRPAFVHAESAHYLCTRAAEQSAAATAVYMRM